MQTAIQKWYTVNKNQEEAIVWQKHLIYLLV